MPTPPGVFDVKSKKSASGTVAKQIQILALLPSLPKNYPRNPLLSWLTRSKWSTVSSCKATQTNGSTFRLARLLP